MADRPGVFRYWGDRKPDTSRPLLTYTRAAEAVTTVTVSTDPGAADGGGDPAVPAPAATLRIYGPIDSWGGYWGVSAKEVANALDCIGPVETLIVRVNSPGGEAFEGRAIMNLLRANAARCVAVVDGLAASAASYIAVGCDETVMSPGTELMIHDTSCMVYGNAAELRKHADVLDSISNSGAELYAQVAGGTREEWRAVMAAETWFTAQEAVDAGLADRVEVVPDSGPAETASEEPAVVVELPEGGEDDRARPAFDLSLFTYAGRESAPAPKLPTASAGGSTTTEGGSAVAFSDEQYTTLRDQFGLPADADEDAIMAAIVGSAKESGGTASTQLPEGMVLVESAVLAELRKGAEAGTQALEAQRVARRDALISEAIRDGRTMPARREHWAAMFDADPEGAAEMLAKLEPGLVPVTESGHATAPAGAGDDLYAELFGDEKQEG